MKETDKVGQAGLNALVIGAASEIYLSKREHHNIGYNHEMF